MAKYWSSVVAQRVAGSAIEWAGGVGFTRETGIEKYWRDSKIVRCPSLLVPMNLTDVVVCVIRALFMRAHRTSSCKRLPSSSKKTTHSRLYDVSVAQGLSIPCSLLVALFFILNFYQISVLDYFAAKWHHSRTKPVTSNRFSL